MSESQDKAYIGNIQHCNVHDGNGFRTTVFFQGCNMKCKWCQNPELQSLQPIFIYNKPLCINCGACKNEKSIEKQVEVCYSGAKTCSSTLMTTDEVIEECLKESFFFKYHGGGVTLSGGEPLIHTEFVIKLLHELKKRDVNTAVETAGYIPFKNIESVVPYVDTFLYDVKLISENKRKEWLGIYETIDLDNLTKLSQIHRNIVIRIPLIPEVNDTESEFEIILNFLDELSSIKHIHILPFHQLGARKYEMIGREYEMNEFPLNEKARIMKCEEMTKERGYQIDIGGAGFTNL